MPIIPLELRAGIEINTKVTIKDNECIGAIPHAPCTIRKLSGVMASGDVRTNWVPIRTII